MRYLSSFFSLEVFFTLWLFSYQYKNAANLFLNYDITLLLTVLLIPWGLILYFKGKRIRTVGFLNCPVAAFLVMSGWFLTTTLWSPSYEYKMQKALCYAVYTLPGFLIGCLVICAEQRRVRRLLMTFFIFSFLLLLECLRTFWGQGLSRITDVLGSNYLVTGQTLVTGLSVLMAWSFTRFAIKDDRQPLRALLKPLQFSQLPGLLGLFLSGLYVYVLLNLGGRGPLIAFGLALSCFYLIHWWRYPSAKQVTHLGFFLAFSMLAWFSLNKVFGHTSSHFIQRLSPLLIGQVDESVAERVSYYQSALAAISQHPITGVGLGGWPMFQGSGDIALHPHNIFLEILAETGIIGFILFVAFSLLSVHNLIRVFSFSSSAHIAIVLITLTSFCNALKSGDLHDNIVLFISLSVCAGLKKQETDDLNSRKI